MVVHPLFLTVDLALGTQVFLVGFAGVFVGLGLLFIGMKATTAVVRQLEKRKALPSKQEGDK